MITLMRVALNLYEAICLQILVYEAFNWAQHVTLARHAATCDRHGGWRPRWAGGVGHALVGTAFNVLLWPIWAVSYLLDLPARLRYEREGASE